LQQMTSTFAAQIGGGQAVQFVVNQRHQLIERLRVAAAPLPDSPPAATTIAPAHATPRRRRRHTRGAHPPTVAQSQALKAVARVPAQARLATATPARSATSPDAADSFHKAASCNRCESGRSPALPYPPRRQDNATKFRGR
jgi:hypothetical protein